jgi:peroxiredoxin
MKRISFIFLFLLPLAAHALVTSALNINSLTPLVPPPPLTIQHKAGKNAPFPAVPKAFPTYFQIQTSSQASPSSSVSAEAVVDPATLHWKNGETLHGDIATASATVLTWKTSLFEDPLQLRWDVIDQIDWPVTEVQPADPFGIKLRDGSFLYGNLVSISADSVSVHSTRHGDILIKRSEILSARRLPHGNLRFSGPIGDLGWKPVTAQQNGTFGINSFAPGAVPSLMTGPGGAMEIQSWNRGSQLEITLPDPVVLDFRLHSSKRPEFVLSFGESTQQALRIETWDNEMVLVAGQQFKIIRKIQDDEREVALRVCWDQKSKKCSVFTPAGELITAWEVPGTLSSPGTGLILQNRGLDLSLDFLQVREWNGKALGKIDPNQPHIELADGRSIVGEISTATPGSIHLQPPGQTAGANFPLADIDALIFSSQPPQIASHEATLLYNDGAILFGNIASISSGHAVITTSFTKESLSSKLDIPRQLVVQLPNPQGMGLDSKALAKEDKILIEQTTLHGKLGSVEDASLGWTPIGGLSASRPSKSFSSEITRFIPPDAPVPEDTALFYLSSGDILPGNLQSMDRTGAEFESSLMAARKLPADELNAIEFGAPTRSNVQSFNDPGWQIVKGTKETVRITEDKLQMDPGTAIAYPSLMQSSEISFKYVSNGFSAARLRMFCSKTDPSRSINLLLGSTGNQFIAGTESTEGQFDTQVQVKTRPGDPVSVRLEVGEDEVELFVNDVSIQHIPIDPSKRAGSGLIIEPASLWGNSTFSLSLSNFSSHSGPGHIWLPDVSDDTKTQVLTVPRFQKDDPPKHLLLAANGDVLRGEIEAATATHLGFRSGLENLSVPRDRVRAVIWLKPPDPAAPINPATPAPPDPLKYRLQMRINFGMVGLRQVMSFIQSQDRDLKIKLPEDSDQRMRSVQLGNQSLGEALKIICSRFDLHYRVDSDGTVILEPSSMQLPNDFVSKTYWLKPDAIPKATSVQELLTTKGITFPKGSSAQWQSAASLLSMINTAENETKLAALVNSDFGGSLGAPTQWLQLINGARFPLAVDKIGPDFITGHHLLYGAIKVPMAQVYIIRSIAPEPSAEIKSLENWRLVNAPEPVLPEGSGEISPLLGKDAATFKLPLLAGGDFDLAAEKGQIVVLDFWATWCGPCVKSLPGLIDTVSSFPADRVKLIGINQGEAPEQVKHFLEAKGLKYTVAMDADQGVGRKYGVDAIPHTVIVGPDGKVAWVQTGYSPDGDSDASDAIKRLLAPPSPANPGPTHL